MSYNINKWKTKELKNLEIPIDAFFKHPRTDWHPEQHIEDAATGRAVLECGCEQKIHGFLADGKFKVTEFDMSGEGSGTFMEWILEPALKESIGFLEAVLIWEGGDTVERLTVKDGVVVTKTLIDL